MKRNARWPSLTCAILVLAALVFFPVTEAKLSGDHSPRKADSGTKEKPAGKHRSTNKKDADAARRRPGFANSAQDPLQEPDDGDDPDLPPFQQGKIDKAELLRLRDEQIAMIRGIQPGQPFDPEARSRALEMMEQQESEQRRAGAFPPGAFPKRSNQGTGAATSLIEALTFPNWVELGPNPIPLGQTSGGRSNVSGRVSAIEIDPNDANKVYVGAAQGGVFRSLDGGATWTPIFDQAQSLAVGSLTLDPVRDWLWVGTGEANGSADSFAGVGLYRIENASTTANLVGPINPIRNYIDQNGVPQSAGFFSGRSISKIIRVPNDPNTLFCGVAGGVIGIGGNPPLGNALPPLAMRGLVRLSNVLGPPAGITGTRIAVSTNPLGGVGGGLCFDTPCTVNRNVNDMVLDPQDASGNTLIVWLNGVNSAGDGGIYRSTNAMSASPTFTQTLITTSTSTSNGRGELRAYQRGGATVVYAASGEPSNNTGTGGSTLCNSATNFGALRRSIDGGVTWSNKLAGGGGFCSTQCFYNIGFDVLAGASTSTDKLLLGGNVTSGACARQESTSLDGAATAFTAHDSITHADTHVIKIAPSNSSIVYRGDDGGIWKSTDGGNSFVPLNNATFRATQFQSLAFHPTDPDFTIGGTQDNGTERLTTGPTWFHSDDGDGGFTEIDQNAVNTTTVTMYHTYFNQAGTQIGYARATSGNQGPTWSFLGCTGTATTRGIACTNTVNFYAPLAIGPGTPTRIYLGTDRLYRSADSGLSNTVVSQGPLVSGVPLSAIGIARNDDNYRIVGLNNGALFYTTTGSSTLTSLDPVGGGSTIPDFYVGRLVFDPANKNTVYISLNGYSGGTAPSQSHVWKITNLNTIPVKTPINGSGANLLPDVPVNAFAVDINDGSHPGASVLYAGTDIGVYQSVDGGANWVPFGTGLPRVAVFDMGIPNGKRVVRIATHGRGMWEIDIPICTISCPANINVDSEPSQCGAVVNYTPATSGTCGTVTCSPASGSFFPLGATNVTCTSQANTSCTFSVTVSDHTPPAVSCPAPTTASADAGCQAAIPDVTGGTTTSDNCGPVTVMQSPAAGTLVGLGPHTITLTATDPSGNSSSCTTTFTVVDTTPPKVSCPAPTTASADANCSAAIPDVTGSTTTSDNCGPVTVTQSPAAGTLVGLGPHPIAVTAKDGAGNSSTCTTTFTVVDNTPPAINCPANITVDAEPGACLAHVTYAVKATDNCSVPVVSTDIPSGSAFPKGTTTVHATATDAAGNSSSCSFTVTVNDSEKPVISCPANIIATTAPGLCAAVVNYTVTATDNCPGVTVATDIPSGSVFPKGTTTVHATATDAAGNKSECAFNVTVVDNEPPSVTNISATPDSLWPPDHRMVDVTVNYNASDNCGAVTCVLSVSSNEPENGLGDGDTAPDWEVVDAHHVRLRAERSGTGNGRVYTITITCTDSSGNTTVGTVAVKVPKNQS